MNFFKKSVCFAFCAIAFISCQKKAGTLEKNNDSTKISFSVVTTIFPCYDAVRAVLGNQTDFELADGREVFFSVKMLVKPGAEVHSFDPAPQDIIAVQKSDLFVYVGGESDEWVRRILKNSDKSDGFRVNFMELPGIKKLGEFENPAEEDEHVWTSPENEKIIVKKVCSALSLLVEQNELTGLAAKFAENTALYAKQIDQVSQKTAAVIAAAQNPYIVMADRFPFAYFADYYGIDYLAAFAGCSTAVEASSYTISKLIQAVKQKDLPAVFYIELGNHKIADSVAESAGVPALLLQSVQNVTKSDFENEETWVTLMEQNFAALSKGLK